MNDVRDAVWPGDDVRPRVTEVTTERVRLRAPTEGDRKAFCSLVQDPLVWGHSPAHRPTGEAAHASFDDLQQRWETEGYDYWIVESVESGALLGLAGVRRVTGTCGAVATLNLHFRLTASAHGQGLGKQVAQAAVGWATEHLPHLPVVAASRSAHEASAATLQRAGLVPVGTDPRDDGHGDMTLWAAPRFDVVSNIDDALGEELLDVWCAVNASGGAVGFTPGAARSSVAEVLHANRDAMAQGTALLGVLRDPAPEPPAPGPVVGFAWWLRDPATDQRPNRHHVVKLSRAQIRPDAQGRNCGNLLLHGMHGVASRWGGVTVALLSYRSGSFHDRFYRAHQYTEVGRLTNIMTVTQPDGSTPHFDEVMMMRPITPRPQ